MLFPFPPFPCDFLFFFSYAGNWFDRKIQIHHFGNFSLKALQQGFLNGARVSKNDENVASSLERNIPES